MGIFTSKGLKRFLASIVTTLLATAVTIPAAAPIIPLLTWAAGVLGVTGVAHAAAAGTLTSQLPATIASVIAALLVAAKYVPALAPFVPLLEALAGIFGGVAIAKGISVESESKEV